MGTTLSNVNPGDVLVTPGARQLVVSTVVVPRNNPSASVPAQFRAFPRKVVIFSNGAAAPLAEVQRHYRSLSAVN